MMQNSACIDMNHLDLLAKQSAPDGWSFEKVEMVFPAVSSLMWVRYRRVNPEITGPGAPFCCVLLGQDAKLEAALDHHRNGRTEEAVDAFRSTIVLPPFDEVFFSQVTDKS